MVLLLLHGLPGRIESLLLSGIRLGERSGTGYSTSTPVPLRRFSGTVPVESR